MIERARVDHGSRTRVPQALLLSLSLLLLTEACGVKKPAGDAGADTAATSSGGASGSGSGGSNGAGGASFDTNGFDINLNDINLNDLNLDLNVTTCPAGVKTGDSCANTTACTAGANVGCICFAARWTCGGI